jgi:hypothetical protein
MKNLHVIPVDKEPVKGDLLLRHIWKGEPNECISWWRYNDTTMYGDTLVYTTLNGSFMDVPSSFKVQNIYITSDEEAKDGDWCIVGNGVDKLNTQFTSKEEINAIWKKIILTTDQDLIADGVEAIDDEFLEWFVKNPSCEYIQTTELSLFNGDTGESGHYKYEIIIPQEEPKQDTVGKEFYESADKTITVYRQETLEEAAEKRIPTSTKVWDLTETRRNDFSAGAKWQQEQNKKMYSEEDLKEAFKVNYRPFSATNVGDFDKDWNKWFEQFFKKK